MSLDIFHQWICLWDLQILLCWKILFRVPLTMKYRNSMEFISLQMRLIQLEFGSKSSFSPIWIYIFTNHKSSKWLISGWPKTMVLYLFWNPHSEIQNISKGGGIFNSYLLVTLITYKGDGSKIWRVQSSQICSNTAWWKSKHHLPKSFTVLCKRSALNSASRTRPKAWVCFVMYLQGAPRSIGN